MIFLVFKENLIVWSNVIVHFSPMDYQGFVLFQSENDLSIQ